LKYRTGDLSMLARTRFATLTIAAGTSLALAGRFAGAQQTAAAAAAGPVVNDVAPDFTLQGADRYGLIKTPVRLSDYRGRTVVLAFFYQARTKG
jgi:cytochrome oxidase Cu insertion factor (SCO1/SenC/PrrC family)